MSIDLEGDLEGPDPVPTGFPELTELGKQIEMLRIQRGLSKQHLARHAGTSRQQLWRVMTGKSELTAALRQRLADVLGVDRASLLSTSIAAVAPATLRLDGAPAPATTQGTAAHHVVAADVARFVQGSAPLADVLARLPRGRDGLRLKRALLDAVEDLALERALPLDAAFFDVRRRVLAGEL